MANELFDAMVRFPFTGRQQKILLRIVRLTYGYQRKDSTIRLVDLVVGTGLSKGHCSTVLAELAEMEVVTKSVTVEGLKVGIIKDYLRWKVVPKSVTRSQIGNLSSQIGNQTVTESGTPFPPSPPLSPYKEIIKKTPPPPGGVMGLFDRWYATYPRKKSRGDAVKAWKALKPDEALTERMIAAVQAQTIEKADLRKAGRFCPEWAYPATWLRASGWEDEVQQALPPAAGEPKRPQVADYSAHGAPDYDTMEADATT